MANEITIIVPSFKRPSDLRRCLEAVAIQSRAADEVLVIGREGDRETSEVVSSLQSDLSPLRLVSVREPGLVAAMNRGLDSARGDLLVFTDDDAEAQVDWLERIEAKFADPSVGAVGGRDWLQETDFPALFQPSMVSRVGILTWYGAQYGNHHCPLKGHTRRVMFLKGVNMAFRRRALGSYRIDLNLRGSGAQAGTEVDLCSRVSQAGFHVLFDDRILVKHYASPRPDGEDRTLLTGQMFPDVCFNNHYLIAKHFGLRLALTYFCHERLLGSRSMPGVLACMKWSLKGDWSAWQRLVWMGRNGLEGFRAGRRSRMLAQHDGAILALDCSSGTTNRFNS